MSRTPKRGSLRHEIVSLLTDFDPQRSDFSRKPWRLWHLSGRPFTARESLLANSATLAELQAAQSLAAAVHNRSSKRQAGLNRAGELFAPYMRDPDETEDAVVARMPEQVRAEYLDLMRRYPPEDA